MKQLIAYVIIGLTFMSCQTYSDNQKDEFDNKIKSYVEKNELQCERSNSGLYYNIIEEGEGRKVLYRDIVRFKYEGKLLDGTVFDDHKEEAVEFQVSELIAAWKEIMLELNEGGKAYIIAPPQLGYGDHNLDDIPPNSILIFTIEIVEVI
jgi:FKBP-type peptidyl-prolyl cis-trans isomerase FkpA